MVPEDLWIHAAPPSLLFGDANQGVQGIDGGSVSDVVATQTGSGSLAVSGIPRGAFIVRLLCSRGGDINSSDVANLSASLPQFRVTITAGLTYSHPITVSDNRDLAVIEYAPLGLRFEFRNGVTSPAFTMGDAFDFITTPSADIIAGIPVVCASMDKYLAGSFDLPLLEFPADFTAIACDLLRWRLLKKIGVVERQDIQAYKPVESWDWLAQARRGDFVKPFPVLGIKETPSGTSVQDFVAHRDLLCSEFPI